MQGDGAQDSTVPALAAGGDHGEGLRPGGSCWSRRAVLVITLWCKHRPKLNSPNAGQLQACLGSRSELFGQAPRARDYG